MTDDPTIEKISSVRVRLDESSERLNTALRTLQDVLNKRQIRTQARVTLRSRPSGIEELCWMCIDKQWGLFIEHLSTARVMLRRRHLVRDSRELRLLASQAVPKLIDAILAAVEQEERRLESSLDVVAGQLARIQGGKS